MDEVRGALELLEWLSLEGCCVSGDSNFCDRNIIDKIIASKADYLLALKGKSPVLLEAVSTAFSQEQTKKTVFQTEETGHGRHEKRIYRVIQAEELPQQATQSYTQLRQIIEVTRFRTVTRIYQYIPRKRTIISLAWMRSPRSLLIKSENTGLSKTSCITYWT
ncbi:MAG: ISAs1 family transposase [Lewinellaceae bacterium]|nr:ISAs1 family transposase [Lewinellaceae bacterium]